MNRNKLQPGWEDIDELTARVVALEQDAGRRDELADMLQKLLDEYFNERVARHNAAIDAQLSEKPL